MHGLHGLRLAPSHSPFAPAMRILLSLLTVLAGATAVVGQDLITAVKWDTDVIYSDSTLWNTVDNGQCGIADHYTFTNGASVTVAFIGASCTALLGTFSDQDHSGHKIRVDGMTNSQGGMLGVQVDNLAAFIMNTWSENVTCGLLFEYDLGFGNHTLVMSLFGNWTAEGIARGSTLHITDITYAYSTDCSAWYTHSCYLKLLHTKTRGRRRWSYSSFQCECGCNRRRSRLLLYRTRTRARCDFLVRAPPQGWRGTCGRVISRQLGYVPFHSFVIYTSLLLT